MDFAPRRWGLAVLEVVPSVRWTGAALVPLLVVTVILLLRNWNWWYYAPMLRKGQAPLPPGDMGWPVIGQILDFLRAFKSSDPDSFIGNMTKRWGRHSLYRTHLFGQPTVLATTAESIKQVCMNGEVFKSGWPKSTRTVLGRKSFAVLEGDEHRRLRRLTSQALQGQEVLKNYIPKIEDNCKERLKSWAKEGQFQAVPKLQEFTFEVISSIFMSYGGGPVAQQLLHDFELMVYGLRAMAINIPGFAYHKSLQARKKVINALQSILDERRMNKTVKYSDVLETLLETRDENGVYLTDEEIIDTLVVFLVAGHQSSTFSIAWVMIFVQRHPEVLRACREEQLRIQKSKSPGEHLTYADFRNMTYLSSVIDETMRIVNVSPFAFRRVSKTVEIDGFTVPKGWFIETWLRAAHLDERVYPEPYEFKPERWQTFKPRTGQFMLFGLGSRSCIGNELAKLEMSIFLHHAILSYRWEPVNPHSPTKYLPHPQPVDGYLVNFSRI
ncbi:hypothetical protein R1sor_016114 [Riccia sorocarpa]|uniref:Cytochrome P450 n=1 Tax=Riccia sorocarpa TaxID=122646 RepID=A0ABD3HE30_9MARC